MIKTFGLWLDTAIQHSGLSKKEVANRAGVSDGLVYQVTTDGKKPSADFCVKMAFVLKLPTVEVLQRAGFPAIAAPYELFDNEQAEMWVLCQMIPKSDRATVLKMLRGLVDQTP